MSIRRSLAWSLADRYAATCLGFVSVVILSRLLTPAETGIYAVAYSVVALCQTLRDFGTSSYLIQEPVLTQDRIRAAFGLTLVTGFSFGGLTLLLAWPAARWYRNADLAPVLDILSLNFFLWPIGAPIMALLRRDMKFDVVAKINLVSSLVQPGMSVLLVACGYKYFGLAWGAVSGTAAVVMLAVVQQARGSWLRPSLRDWRTVGEFGWQATAAGLLSSFSSYSNDIIIGRLIGFAAAGTFSRANGLPGTFVDRLWSAAGQVVFAEYARRHRGEENVNSAIRHTLALLCGFGWPFLAVLAIAAPSVVRLVFGSQWDAAIPLVRIMCVASALELVALPLGPALMATGNVRSELLATGISGAARVAGVSLGGIFGLQGAAVGSAFSSLIGLAVTCRLAARNLGFAPWSLTPALRPSALLTVCSGALPVMAMMAVSGAAGTLGVVCLTAAGAILGWLGGVHLLDHPLRSELVGTLRWIGQCMKAARTGWPSPE